MTDRLEVGHISRAHGLRGEVTVILTTDRTERVEPGTVLHDGDRDLVVVSSRPHQNGYIVQFDRIQTRDDAEAARGRTLSAEPLDDPGVLWVHELIGAEVVETDGTARGTIESIQANPASDLMVLDSGALVPLVFMTGRDGRTVTIDPPEGLFDVQA